MLAVAQFACTFGSRAPGAAPQQPAGDSNAPSAPAGTDQVAVSGALNKSFAPVNVSIGQFGPAAIRLYLNEATPADLSRTGDLLTLDFPADIQPGTYPFDNFVTNPSATIWATYGTTDGQPASFSSTQGTLVITAVGQTYSGNFKISAADTADPSRTLEISGSFTNLPFNK